MNSALKISVALFFAIVLFQSCQNQPKQTPIFEPEEEKKTPYDYLYNQRAYPHNHIDVTAYQNALSQTQRAKNQVVSRNDLNWELAGPTNIGGRITDIALHPTDQNIIYAGASVGGVWKSEDQGETWTPIFENEGAMSIGDITLAPSDPNILYVGTGEANGSATSGAFFGNGVYKSTDGGDTWTHLGLENSQHIGRIAVHPLNPDEAYVAAAGALYEKNDDRGLYKTTDGGETWDKVLFVSDSTSVIDVVINGGFFPVLYAATWERVRRPWQRSYGGITSGIHRSVDGGETWEEMTNGLPNDDPNIGRIGLATSQLTGGLVYACYTTNPITNTFEGVYRTTNAGESWIKMDNDPYIPDVFASFGWFFGNIRVSPVDDDKLWVLGQILMESDDGGAGYEQIAQDNHVDNHGLEIHPQNPDFMVAGNDGGVYISKDGGESWTHVETLPVTQFYECEIHPTEPEILLGGTQDNGSMLTFTGELDDWQTFLGGDGFHVLVNPVEPNYIYGEYQFGNLFRSDNNANFFEFIYNGLDDRTNWNTPVVFDPSNPSTLYYGGHRLHRSEDYGTNWDVISPDLTDGQHPSGSLSFGTITAIAVAPSNSDYIYVGTDDGNIRMTTVGETIFTDISNGVPDRHVTELAVDSEDENIVYATLSGYRLNDYQPHVLRSTNAGQDWEDISGNLPEIPVNDIILDPDFDDTYYIANDLGVWFTKDGGANWEILDASLPATVVNDLDFHPATRKLVAATFGRSLYSIDLTDLFVQTQTEKAPTNALTIFPNPVQDVAIIQLELEQSTSISIELFDLMGRKIKTILNGQLFGGQQQIPLDMSDLANGQYLVRMVSKEEIWTKKVLKE